MEESMRIVVVDPDPMTAKLLRFVLGEAGHEVQLTKTAKSALATVLEQETDALLLKTDLPDSDGWILCKELRGHRYTGPIIFVTKRNETQAKLRAFEHGADDFIAEPFDPAELVARVDAVSRRCKRADLQALGTLLKVGDAELSIGELTFRAQGRPPVYLTPTEMRMLECLMRNHGITISRDTLIERTWDHNFIGDSNRVEVYVRRVRKKIELDPAQPEYLHTVRGVGYVFRSSQSTDVRSNGANGHTTAFSFRPVGATA
jgi:two-component system response regulator RegX3